MLSLSTLYSSYKHNILALDNLYLSKLQEKFVLVDICNTVGKLRNNLYQKINDITCEKNILPLIIDRVQVETIVEPC